MAGRPKAKQKSEKSPTKPKAKKKAAPKKKKPIDIFANNKEVSQKQVVLKELEKNRKSLEKDIKEIVDNYNAKTFQNRDAEKFLDKLPIDSLKELEEFSSGKKRETNLEILKIRSQLRKDRNQKIEELYKVDEKISEGQIDLLLAKINHMIEKIDTDKKE